jgi:cytochrome P450
MTLAAGPAAPEADIRFQDDPLACLDRHIAAGEETFWLSPSTVCIAPPDAAKAVLANGEGRFRENSDFFHTRRGPFGPRSLQLELARGARRLLTDHAAAHRDSLADTVATVLGPSSHWPDAGNRLIHRHFAAALLAPERASALGPLLEAVLEKSVRAGARERRSKLARAFFRRRVFRALRLEVERRTPDRRPRDLFDVLALGIPAGARSSDLGELYLPFFFAVVGSVGFTLAWALRLLGEQAVDGHPIDGHPIDAEVESGWIVREALRLWPIAWQMDRYPAETHVIAGVEVTPETQVLISPYVTQRHPAYWSEPLAFRPQRWAEAGAGAAFFPFGWGPHTCAAASLSLEVAAQILDVIREGWEMRVHTLSQVPFTGPSLAPPCFRLDLSPRTPRCPKRGGDSLGENP